MRHIQQGLFSYCILSSKCFKLAATFTGVSFDSEHEPYNIRSGQIDVVEGAGEGKAIQCKEII